MVLFPAFLCPARGEGWGGCTAECWSLLNVQARVKNRSLPALREGLSPTLVQFCLQDVRKNLVFPVTCALVRFWCCQVLLFTSWVAMCSDSTLLLPVLVSFSFHFLSTPDLLDLRVWWVFKPCVNFCLTGPCLLPNLCLSFCCCCFIKMVKCFSGGHQNGCAIYTWSFLLPFRVSLGKYFIPNVSVPDPVKSESATQATASFLKIRSGFGLVLFLPHPLREAVPFHQRSHAEAYSQVFQKYWPQLGGDKRHSISRSLF